METRLAFERLRDIPDDFKMIWYVTLVNLGVIKHLQPTNLLQISGNKNAADSVVKLLLFEREGGAVGVREVNEHFNAFLPFEISAILLKEELIGVKSLDVVFPSGVELRYDFLD